MTAEEIATALGGKRTGKQFVARCPEHDDRNPSLSIVATRDCKILVKCFAGCEQRDVIAALRDRGLWPEGEPRDYTEAYGTLVKTYDYTDEHGRLLYQVCRCEPKTFRPRRSDGRRLAVQLR
jgi:hypothetical protein